MALYDVVLNLTGYKQIKETREGNSGRLVGQELLREAEAALDEQLEEYTLSVDLASPKPLGLTPTTKSGVRAAEEDEPVPPGDPDAPALQ